jgi:hypothetical protein
MKGGADRLLRRLFERDQVTVHVVNAGESNEESYIEDPQIHSISPKLGGYVRVFARGRGRVEIAYDELQATFVLDLPDEAHCAPWNSPNDIPNVREVYRYSRLKTTKA